MTIQDNLERVQERIATAARRAGRNPAEVTLVGVTKTQPVESILTVLRAGLRDLGENRVLELETKRRQVEERVGELQTPIWHMVGHIQSRKAARVVPLADWVHSLDSLKLARRLDRFAANAGIVLPVLIEINLSGEESKYGWPATRWRSDDAQWGAIRDFAENVNDLAHLQVRGLMTMAPWVPDPDVIRPVFESARLMRERLAREVSMADCQHLSMGMTDDFEIAIEEGATIVRVGRAIFGPR
jgi:pyridoxal phosphate enzyme (YggS family)